jgi:SNF2 family DNA or RNA helicase
LNGNQDFDTRATVVDRFNRDPELRVILISNAGSTGLNLNVANNAILFDTLWTVTQADQIEGRVKRLGQTERVNIFYITALKTTDIMMNAIAATKGRMFEEFVGWKQNRGKPCHAFTSYFWRVTFNSTRSPRRCYAKRQG